MLRTENAAGTHIYPDYKSGQLDTAHLERNALTVFVPSNTLRSAGDDTWACTIEGKDGAVVLDTYEDLWRLITALEIAIEKVRARDNKP